MKLFLYGCSAVVAFFVLVTFLSEVFHTVSKLINI
jgi:hypothetical protein